MSDFAFEYLGISGDFIHLCKNNFIGSDSTEYFLDSVFLVMVKRGDDFEEAVIDLEHQSSHVTLEKLKTLNLYSVHASYYFVKPVVSIVLTDVDSYNKFIIKNERIVYVILQVLKLMINYFFDGDELIELNGMINMEFEEAIEKLFDPRFNELNDEVYQLNQKLKLANEEKDIALSNARLAIEEKDIALSNVKLLKEEHNHLIEVLDNLIKQGKLSKEDLYLAGIIL